MSREFYIVNARGERVPGCGGFFTADGYNWAVKLLMARDVPGERVAMAYWGPFARTRAFLLGVREFRRSVTSRVAHERAYEWGREWAHRLTARRWDN